MCVSWKCIYVERGLTFQQCKCHTVWLFATSNLVRRLSATSYSYTNDPTEMQPVFCEVIEWNPKHTSASRPSAFKAAAANIAGARLPQNSQFSGVGHVLVAQKKEFTGFRKHTTWLPRRKGKIRTKKKNFFFQVDGTTNRGVSFCSCCVLKQLNKHVLQHYIKALNMPSKVLQGDSETSCKLITFNVQSTSFSRAQQLC